MSEAEEAAGCPLKAAVVFGGYDSGDGKGQVDGVRCLIGASYIIGWSVFGLQVFGCGCAVSACHHDDACRLRGAEAALVQAVMCCHNWPGCAACGLCRRTHIVQYVALCSGCSSTAGPRCSSTARPRWLSMLQRAHAALAVIVMVAGAVCQSGHVWAGTGGELRCASCCQAERSRSLPWPTQRSAAACLL